MDNLQIFKNELFEVSTKLKDGTILFDAETVARSLGITQKKNGIDYIRWERVKEYSNSPDVGKGSFIPEPMVYKLAFKASNETAEKFQDWLAIEVIPSIRKHGGYLTNQKLEEALLNPDVLIQLATNLKEEQTKRRLAEQQIERDKPKVLFADSVESSTDSILIGQLAKLICQNGYEIGQNRLFEWLRNNGYLVKSGENKNLPTQYSMDRKLMDIKKRTVNNPDGSIRTTVTTKITGKGQIYFINKFLNN